VVPKKCVEGKNCIPSRCICVAVYLAKNCKKRESNLTPSSG